MTFAGALRPTVSRASRTPVVQAWVRRGPRRGADLDRDAGVLWQDALRHLAQHVSRPNFTTWLESTEGVRLDGDTLVVGTRSEFVTEWLQKRLLPLIVRTTEELLLLVPNSLREGALALGVALQGAEEEAALVAEGGVQAAGQEPGALAEALHARSGVAVLPEDLGRGVDHLGLVEAARSTCAGHAAEATTS